MQKNARNIIDSLIKGDGSSQILKIEMQLITYFIVKEEKVGCLSSEKVYYWSCFKNNMYIKWWLVY